MLDKGYDRVCTPHLAKEELYQTSGHAGKYLEDMFSVYGGTSKENFFLEADELSAPYADFRGQSILLP
jgi:threonyl-tRNA synthetase